MSEVQILSPRPILTDTKGRQAVSCEIEITKRRFYVGGVFVHIEVAKRIVRTSPVSEPPRVSAISTDFSNAVQKWFSRRFQTTRERNPK